jgi:hypothetical protein
MKLMTAEVTATPASIKPTARTQTAIDTEQITLRPMVALHG